VPDPEANPVLRSLVEKAKRDNVPSHVIEKAPSHFKRNRVMSAENLAWRSIAQALPGSVVE
jgi:transcriptional/translational regulatory protein YebC/TACO1